MPAINTNYNSGIKAYETATATAAKVEEELAGSGTTPPKEDTFVKSGEYKMDTDKVNAMKLDLGKNISAFKNMVQAMFRKQGGLSQTAGGPMDILLEIDKATQLAAQEAVSENGEWGVEQTAQRILDFAMALSGGDPSKIETLRDAVQKGFAEAESVWGGKLPDISYQTYDRIMRGFDEWKNGGAGPEAAAAE